MSNTKTDYAQRYLLVTVYAPEREGAVDPEYATDAVYDAVRDLLWNDPEGLFDDLNGVDFTVQQVYPDHDDKIKVD